MTPPTGVGASLRTHRSARGMSLSEVAAQSGVSTATLSRIETEKQSVDVALLLTISRVLQVSAADLLGDGKTRDSERSLVDSLALLAAEERAKVIAAATRRRASRGPVEPLHVKIDALLATLDMIRHELSAIQREARQRRR